MRKQPRPLIDLHDGTFAVPLTRGFHAIIDAIDKPLVESIAWHAFVSERSATVYAQGRPTGTAKVYMHRFILGDAAQAVDHANGVGTDNRRSNLRPATISQNAANSHKVRGSISLKGVSAQGRMFSATCNSDYLGTFATARAAAMAYDAEAIRRFGSFARTNAALGLLDQQATVSGANA
jgi:hypothetical protein